MLHFIFDSGVGRVYMCLHIYDEMLNKFYHRWVHNMRAAFACCCPCESLFLIRCGGGILTGSPDQKYWALFNNQVKIYTRHKKTNITIIDSKSHEKMIIRQLIKKYLPLTD